jgi:hypothetical protein
MSDESKDTGRLEDHHEVPYVTQRPEEAMDKSVLLPDLWLIRNPKPVDEFHDYICPKHGDVAGITYTHVELDKTETEETFCFRCVMDHLKASPIARLDK